MRVIDSWVNVAMPSPPAPWQRKVAQEVFKRAPEDVFRKFSVAEMLAMMDALGVEKAIITAQPGALDRDIAPFIEQQPERFALSVLVDPRTGMKALRQLESMAKAHPVKLARVVPSMIDLPPNDRAYYPLYAKCVELGLPISINTGIPGPALPGRCQDPMLLDDVCLFFPELVIVMANGADPWWDVAIRLMVKYKNLYMQTSACAPKYLPPSLLHYMGTRGKDKVMFATDFPFLTMERCLDEAKALGLGDDALDGYLYANAARVLFGAS
ncbi:MAG TPA: amidohydrolase family protein [Kofleriaceae bacterium]